MKLTLEPTNEFQSINRQPHRIWKGTSDNGTPVLAYIRTVSPQTHDEAQVAVFERELKALPAPRRELVSIDLRMVVD